MRVGIGGGNHTHPIGMKITAPPQTELIQWAVAIYSPTYHWFYLTHMHHCLIVFSSALSSLLKHANGKYVGLPMLPLKMCESQQVMVTACMHMFR